ncbi:alpha-galactosidase [Nonomuraea ceibae]|uniref:alpha-galactosidase n=1 Tax=Nonomuraea ceibae TaxID=1935170 RepID=UPI001C5FFB73|nr:alpha-galactosidase [Nonomuraea ceibae]
MPHHLTGGGTTLLLDFDGHALPRVLHWGVELPEADAVPRAENAFPLLPLEADGWLGRPGLAGDRAGQFPHLRLRRTEQTTIGAADAEAGVAVACELIMDEHGVLRMRHQVRNDGDSPYTVAALRAVLPVPDEATELLDLTGRWGNERAPQRHSFGYGTHGREGRQGRPGHDAATLLVAGTPGFGFRHGQVWAVHVGWSGGCEYYAERHPDFPGVLAGGELLASGEVRLAPGETYTSPWVYFIHSAEGLDGISARLHGHLRARPGHPTSSRLVHLNTWEAVYFDHDLHRLKKLADTAAGIGVERFVLDDGWFTGRRNDKAGLGDWQVDAEAWPDGLHPLVDHVRSLGMEFGLWVEPEMVNLDSELARAHPDWVLAAPGRLQRPVRNQHVLDLIHPGAYAYVRDSLDALLKEYDIAYLKWDHNRPLVEAVHEGTAAVRRQTLATYALIDELRARHPGVEIESCASGGGRVDLGILERTDRVWASDTNDPVDRQHIQRWTGLLLPPELVGTHVGPATTHVTGRTTRLSFRCATALFGHAGIEWDITACEEDELAELAAWTAAYRRLRGLLHSGTTVRVDHPDPSVLVHGVVSANRDRAVFCYAQVGTSVAATPLRLRLPGLDPGTRYHVSVCPELHTHSAFQAPDGTFSGQVMSAVGLPLPRLLIADAVVLEIEAT